MSNSLLAWTLHSHWHFHKERATSEFSTSWNSDRVLQSLLLFAQEWTSEECAKLLCERDSVGQNLDWISPLENWDNYAYIIAISIQVNTRLYLQISIRIKIWTVHIRRITCNDGLNDLDLDSFIQQLKIKLVQSAIEWLSCLFILFHFW